MSPTGPLNLSVPLLNIIERFEDVDKTHSPSKETEKENGTHEISPSFDQFQRYKKKHKLGGNQKMEISPNIYSHVQREVLE